MRFAALFAISMLALTACGKSDSTGGGGAAGGGKASGAVTEKLGKIKTALGAAQTGADVDKVSEDCMSLQIESTMSGNDLKNNAEFKAVCEIEYTKALANVAIKNSTPEKMDTKCISASMKLDEMIEAKVEVEAMTALNEQVKKACGM